MDNDGTLEIWATVLTTVRLRDRGERDPTFALKPHDTCIKRIPHITRGEAQDQVNKMMSGVEMFAKPFEISFRWIPMPEVLIPQRF